ncbi:hypothetical protein [Nocardia sp. NPDC005978]|uniref:hypothetical protein n=1 Tax=unclassified Nocardia TaxID=2637762 RepID=UPI0033B88DC5
MTAELIEAIVGAIEEVQGLRPATPFGIEAVSWLPRGGGKAYAVDLNRDVVEIRLAASVLPLPPLLASLTGAVRPLLAGTDFATATVRLRIVELDPAAFNDTNEIRRTT